MRSFEEIQTITSYLTQQRLQEKTIGLVPTMGALHKGHAALIQQSNEENDLTVASIFVNEKQFNRQEDFNNYPSDIVGDELFLERLGCDVVFRPGQPEMYNSSVDTSLSFGTLENDMEGEFRPGHFAGVGLIVSKLFNILDPDRAYFGQKDIQQCQVIKAMTKDLSFQIDIRVVPTVRESDGLAFSSRNVRLTETQRMEAPFIYSILNKARKELLAGANPVQVIEEKKNAFELNPHINLEYLKLVDLKTMAPITALNHNNEAVLCIAAFMGEVRLIDNVILTHDN